MRCGSAVMAACRRVVDRDPCAGVGSLYRSGEKDKAREVFGAFLLMRNAMREFSDLTPYLLKKRGVFKNAVTHDAKGKVREIRLEPGEVEEIEYTFASLKRFLRAWFRRRFSLRTSSVPLAAK